jgi:hypothetical protein
MKIDNLQVIPPTNQALVNKPDLETREPVKLEPLLVEAISEVSQTKTNQDNVVLEEFKNFIKIKISLLSQGGKVVTAIVELTDDSRKENFILANEGDLFLLKNDKEQFFIKELGDLVIKHFQSGEKIAVQILSYQEAVFFEKIQMIFQAKLLPLQNQEILPYYRDWQGFFLPIDVNYQIKVFTRTLQNKKRFLLVIRDNPLFLLDIFCDEEKYTVIIRSNEILSSPEQERIEQLLMEIFLNVRVEIIFNFNHQTLPDLLKIQNNY